MSEAKSFSPTELFSTRRKSTTGNYWNPSNPLTISKLLWVGLLLIFLFQSTCSAQNQASATIETPAAVPQKNVIILLADDLGWGDVGFHDGIASTPNLDRLATESVELTRFYAYPACSPARAALLTGRFPQRFGIVGPVRPREAGLPLDETLLPASFQAAGYQTSLIGKWHLGHSQNESSQPNQRGFDHFYGFMAASVDYFKHTSSRGQLDWQRNGTTIEEPGYTTDLLTSEAIKRIENRDTAITFLHGRCLQRAAHAITRPQRIGC